ncbi:MAG: hypothetical protein GY851_31220, partial [bacterium]|nr:hypothetical protein [bacterium]
MPDKTDETSNPGRPTNDGQLINLTKSRDSRAFGETESFWEKDLSRMADLIADHLRSLTIEVELFKDEYSKFRQFHPDCREL